MASLINASLEKLIWLVTFCCVRINGVNLICQHYLHRAAEYPFWL
jgi:hypothetical protein